MPPKPGEPAQAEPARRRDAMADEAASQLTQLTLFCLLAAIMWFVAVEQPKLEQVPRLLTTVQEMQKQSRDLKEQLATTNRELERVEKATPAGMQASSMKVFQREYEERVVAIRSIVEDVQRQLGAERKQREEHREKDRDIVGQLSQHLKWLDTQVKNLRDEVDSANRLEKANALLEGRLPAGFGQAGAEAEETEDSGGTQSAGADAQPATGGLVELRHGDFAKLLSEGDSWVVMFYAPWCGHCTAAAPAFQQAAIQAPVHFARLDAAAHPDVAQSEEVTGFPTIRFYSKGKVVRCGILLCAPPLRSLSPLPYELSLHFF
jgi:thiol-disulfide isomerase/thioredoxin